MIKIFSNQTNVPKITVQSKFLKNKTTILTPNENGLIQGVKSDTLLFVKVNVSGLVSGESIGKMQLGIAYVNQGESCGLKVIKCPNTTLTEEYIKTFANSLKGEEVVEDTQIFENTINKDDEETIEQKYVVIDLTNMAKKSLGNNPTFMFAIQNDNHSENLCVFDPQFVATKTDCCIATMSNFGGLNSMYKYDKHQINENGIGYINLYNQKLIHIIDGLTSLSKKVPIVYSTIHNYSKSNEKSFLAQELTPNFQYRIYQSGTDYVIEDATGVKNYYQEIDKESEEGKETISTYGIKHLENSGILYFNNLNFSYFYLTRTETKETIKLYDKAENELTFEVLLNEETILFGRFTKFLSMKTKTNETINYHWSGTKLEKITNSDNEEVLFSYDT